MFSVIIVGSFTKMRSLFYDCATSTSARRHEYIIMVIYYFTKSAKAMPTFSNDGETAVLFI
jgi:hypothetical protein